MNELFNKLEEVKKSLKEKRELLTKSQPLGKLEAPASKDDLIKSLEDAGHRERAHYFLGIGMNTMQQLKNF